MTYPELNGTIMSTDVMEIFRYSNAVTKGFAVPLIVTSFFLLVLISSIVMQQRFTSRVRPEVSFLAASFATLGFAVIFEQGTGLLSPIYFFIVIGITILGLLWVTLGSSD